MKTLGTRALTALVFVIVLLGCLLWNYYSFTIFFFIVAMMGLNEFYKLSENLNARPYKIIGFFSGALLYISLVLNVNIFGESGLMDYSPVIIPFLIFSVALFSKKENPIQNVFFTLGGLIYAVLPFGLLHGIVNVRDGSIIDYRPATVLGVILLIWSNDTFAYLGGSLFGKHKMIERISPGKTWEGTIFGVLMTILSGYIVGKFILNENLNLWLALGFIVPIMATVGDLVESMIKRQAGIKDTGNIMPGHGGILDRFDSLIFVTPFVYVIVKLLNA